MPKSLYKFLIIIFLSLPVADTFAAGLLGGMPNQPSGSAQTDILARSAYGNLSNDAVKAYVEALQFCLQQVGQPTQFSASDINVIKQALVQAFPTLPPETQRDLANARSIWTQYSMQWNQISMEEKKEFAYDVLALAYGDAAAAQALGYNQGGSYNPGGGYQGGYNGGGDYSMPDVGNYPGSDCWASAGCVDYDSGSDTYTYESYDYNSGSYETY